MASAFRSPNWDSASLVSALMKPTKSALLAPMISAASEASRFRAVSDRLRQDEQPSYAKRSLCSWLRMTTLAGRSPMRPANRSRERSEMSLAAYVSAMRARVICVDKPWLATVIIGDVPPF
jgi:hypothetical protein